MYNAQEVAMFGSADTKLRQLQAKLKDAEASRNELKMESQVLKRNLNLVSSGIPPMMAERLDSLLCTIAATSLENFDKHIQLLDKTNESQIQVLDKQKECQKALMDAFELIGRSSSYNYVINQVKGGFARKETIRR